MYAHTHTLSLSLSPTHILSLPLSHTRTHTHPILEIEVFSHSYMHSIACNTPLGSLQRTIDRVLMIDDYAPLNAWPFIDRVSTVAMLRRSPNQNPSF